MRLCANSTCGAVLPDTSTNRYCSTRCQHLVAHRKFNANHKVLAWRPPPGVSIPDWSEAACLGIAETETGLPFFEEEGDDEDVKLRNTVARRAAKAICAECPIRDACLEWALVTKEPVGVWGGLDARERRALRRLAVRQKVPA